MNASDRYYYEHGQHPDDWEPESFEIATCPYCRSTYPADEWCFECEERTRTQRRHEEENAIASMMDELS